MSGFLAGKVWQSNLHPDLKPLAAALADIGNDDGTSIYPSVAYMSWLLGRSTRSVQQNLARLRDLGVLVVVDGGAGGRSKSTEYRLVESALPAREKWRKGAITSWFRRPRNHAARDRKRRSLRQETTNPSSPEPLVEPPRTKTTPPTPPLARGAETVSIPRGADFLQVAFRNRGERTAFVRLWNKNVNHWTGTTAWELAGELRKHGFDANSLPGENPDGLARASGARQ
jgi:hypothetical protein